VLLRPLPPPPALLRAAFAQSSLPFFYDTHTRASVSPTLPTQVTDADIFHAFLQQMAKAWDSTDYRMCSFKHVFFDDLSTEDATGSLAPPAAQVRGALALLCLS
jgi:hypothetical protein